jgi:hypothetical protein
VLVIASIAVNAVAVGLRWDPHPFILLNVAFSTQTAPAAPLPAGANPSGRQRQGEALDLLEAHREEVMAHMQQREAAIKSETDGLKVLIEANIALTEGGQDADREVRGTDPGDSRAHTSPGPWWPTLVLRPPRAPPTPLT